MRLNAEPLAQAARWLGSYSQFWEDSFDRLDAFLQPPAPPTKGKTRGRKQ